MAEISLENVLETGTHMGLSKADIDGINEDIIDFDAMIAFVENETPLTKEQREKFEVVKILYSYTVAGEVE